MVSRRASAACPPRLCGKTIGNCGRMLKFRGRIFRFLGRIFRILGRILPSCGERHGFVAQSYAKHFAIRLQRAGRPAGCGGKCVGKTEKNALSAVTPRPFPVSIGCRRPGNGWPRHIPRPGSGIPTAGRGRLAPKAAGCRWQTKRIEPQNRCSPMGKPAI